MTKNWLKTFFPYFIAIILGISLTFAFAPYEIFPLAVFAPAGLMFLWLNNSPKRAFRLGFSFGLGFFGLGVYWVFISVHIFGEVPTALACIITALLVAFLALYPACVGYLLNRYFPYTNKAKIIYAFPAIWVFSEWIRSWFFTGFPWLLIGYSQTNSPLKGFAPILSVFGVSYVALLSSALLLDVYLKYQSKDFKRIYSHLFLLGLIWFVGSLLNLIPWTKPEGKPISISLVQGAIPQEVKWSPEFLQLSLDRYEKLTEPLWGTNRLIIWPEAAIPITLQQVPGYINALDKKALDHHSHLIMGIPIQALNSKGYYNSVVTLGKHRKVYLKRHLVPFGEYTPLANILNPLLNFLHLPNYDLVPGDMKQEPFEIDKLKILTAICYEIAFPELIKTKDKAISFILTVTNDAWFGRSAAQAQHLQMAEMRALELRRPVLMISNDGITAIIGPDGAVKATAPPYETFVLNGSVQPTYGVTPWMVNGMDPILIVLIISLVLAFRTKKLISSDQGMIDHKPRELDIKL